MKQQGSALITALFIMALVVIAATAMSIRLQIDIHRTQSVLSADKLYLNAQGVTLWAIGVLKANAKKSPPGSEEIIDVMPQILPPQNYDGVIVSGKITDEQTLFNINNLGNPIYLAIFARLLKATNPTLSDQEIANISNAILQQLMGNSLEGTRSLTTAFFKKTEELLTIHGITPAIYKNLLPLINVLPEPTQININQVNATILMALGTNITQAVADKIIETRKNHDGFKSIPEFMSLPEINNANIQANVLTVSSNYFASRAEAKIGDQEIVLYDLLKRSIANNAVQVNVISETRY